jgi:hypothetical protein
MTPRILAVLILLALLIACSTTTKQPAASPPAATTASQPAKEPTLYTAKQCFGSMVNLAKRWDLGAMPFHLESQVNAEATGQDGKATVWRGYFASRTRGTMKIFTCSGSRLPSAPAHGFTDGPETAYAANVPALMFDPSSVLIDSDKAFAATLDHGGSALIKKDSKQPVIYSLDLDQKKKEVQWHVIYGVSAADQRGIGVVNARTGAFVGGK